MLIDGVSETDRRTREALRNDLAWLTAHRAFRFILAGRDLGAIRAVLPDQADAGAFRLISLDHTTRRAIADARRLAKVSGGAISVIERQLGHAVDNPLLFTMALAVAAEAGAIGDRPQVYEQFLHGLAARAKIDDSEFDLLVLGGAYAELMRQVSVPPMPIRSVIFSTLLGSGRNSSRMAGYRQQYNRVSCHALGTSACSAAPVRTAVLRPFTTPSLTTLPLPQSPGESPTSPSS